jgi:hypothetical protein
MPPIASDELRLRLLGVQACDGSSDDTERFVRTLRWLAEREETYEPPPHRGDEMPQVTSQEVAQYLSLGDADPLPLQRLYVMLDLDHWGIGGRSSNDNGWSMRLTPDIWRFRSVRSIQDCVAVREAWLAEGRPAAPGASEPLQDAWFHVRLSVGGRSSGGRVLPDLSREALESQILAPYRSASAIVISGDIFRLEDITRIAIWRTDRPSVRLPRKRHTEGTTIYPSNDKWGRITPNG